MKSKSNVSAQNSGFDSSQLNVMRGVMHLSNGEYEAAIAEFSAAIDLYSKNEDAYAFRGTSYSNMGEWDKAISDFTKAIKLTPKVYSYMRRGFAYFMAEDYVKARKDLKEARLLEPEDAEDIDALDELERQLKSQRIRVKGL